MAEARNPSSALLSRIRDAKNGNRGPGSVKGSAKTHQVVPQPTRARSLISLHLLARQVVQLLQQVGLGRKHIGHEKEVTIDCYSRM